MRFLLLFLVFNICHCDWLLAKWTRVVVFSQFYMQSLKSAWKKCLSSHELHGKSIIWSSSEYSTMQCRWYTRVLPHAHHQDWNYLSSYFFEVISLCWKWNWNPLSIWSSYTPTPYWSVESWAKTPKHRMMVPYRPKLQNFRRVKYPKTFKLLVPKWPIL